MSGRSEVDICRVTMVKITRCLWRSLSPGSLPLLFDHVAGELQGIAADIDQGV